MRKLILPLAFAALLGSCNNDDSLPKVDFWVKDGVKKVALTFPDAIRTDFDVIKTDISLASIISPNKYLTPEERLRQAKEIYQRCIDFNSWVNESNPVCLLPKTKESGSRSDNYVSSFPNIKENDPHNFCKEEYYEWFSIARLIRKDCVFKPELLAKYSSWINVGIEDSRKGQSVMIVDKLMHKLDLYVGGRIVKTYNVDVGCDPYKDKEKEGDCRTPEGIYRIRGVNLNSGFYKALVLDYPNNDDLKEFSALKKKGELGKNDTIGSNLEIHARGTGLGRYGSDWTVGCIALTNEDIDDLFSRIRPIKNRSKLEVVIVRYSSREDAANNFCRL